MGVLSFPLSLLMWVLVFFLYLLMGILIFSLILRMKIFDFCLYSFMGFIVFHLYFLMGILVFSFILLIGDFAFYLYLLMGVLNSMGVYWCDKCFFLLAFTFGIFSLLVEILDSYLHVFIDGNLASLLVFFTLHSASSTRNWSRIWLSRYLSFMVQAKFYGLGNKLTGFQPKVKLMWISH